MSLLTVTVNTCVDKTYTVPGFALNRVHRPSETLVTAGGKGINVSRVYRLFGGETTATGFLGGANGQWLYRTMLDEALTPDFVFVAEESRVCLAIMDPENATQTELNENGPWISPDNIEALFIRLRELLPRHTCVVISGSHPLGTPPDLYADIIHLAQEEFGVPAVLDSSGDALIQGTKARPWMLKPNRDELGALGIFCDRMGEAAQALRTRYDVPLAIVTDGARGAALATFEGVWQAVPPPITVASAVGSGDSFTAAFVWATQNGYTMGEALRLGVAAGTANAKTYGAGHFPRATALELAEQVVLTLG